MIFSFYYLLYVMVAFSVFGFDVHWYGIFYAIAFLVGYFFINYIINKTNFVKIYNKSAFLDDLLMYVILGVLLGGRLGYVFFYNFSYFLENPIKVFYVWEGGMAFAGAFIGVAISLYLISKKYKISYFTITDLIVSILPFGLGLGRIGNYLNGELFGKTCPNYLLNSFLCKDYGMGGYNISNQLLESFFEGWLLLIIFQYLIWKKGILLDRGKLTIIFILYYSIVRFLLEFIRYHPKDYILYFGLSISQYLMLLFFLIGIIIFYRFKKS